MVFLKKAAERDTLLHLPRILTALVARDQTILATVEADVDAGNFGRFVCEYFQDEHWDYDHLYCVPELLKIDRRNSFLVGRITFEADPGLLTRLVLGEHGVWQCPNQRIGGVIVDGAVAPQCVRLSPWEAIALHAMAADVRAAFKLDNDLLETQVWLPKSSNPSIIEELRELLGERPTA